MYNVNTERAMDQFIALFANVVQLSQSLCNYPIEADLKYATSENFVGRPIAGYEINPLVQQNALLGKPALLYAKRKII